ncbi:CubicO group peptidase (beta-lactamase class C family) [Lacinutrix venerupis]|uniref:serine hydrolase domain-containing protein n=1 Tax=Lacinutrix venerupis TaxID=1486034 RepID=UPI000EAC4417|nr:serine hydrolase domain-containing protein [Lacinutrix venerupis]RLJ68868.1 CubicO group peptidase (beta-lactamase class C family) [Lacinutrix venerupis]
MRRLILILCFLSTLASAQTDTINKMIESKINHNLQEPLHSILFYFENENYRYNEGFGLVDKNKDTVSKHSAYKIASSTKMFVSTIILQLEEEGKLNITDNAFQYLQDIEYLKFKDFHIFNNKHFAKHITIKQLLSHRSGLADIFTDRKEAFFLEITQHPNTQYSPKKIIELYYKYNLNKEPHFKPNQGWHYSDINYVLLGLIIEKLDNTTLAQSIRNRIIAPLNMKDTYFEFYEKPTHKKEVIHQYISNINFSKINTSFDWAGGGLVSTNLDMATFIQGLFHFKLINQKSLQKIIDVKFTKENESRYGLGVYEFVVNKDTFYGHFGFYGTFIGYSPKTKTTLSYSISQATPYFNTYKFVNEIIKSAK